MSVEEQPADPTTVLTRDVVTAFSKLQVATRGVCGSEPTTPSESPQSLESGLRDWLTETLSTTATNPKVYVKMLVSNAAAGSIIGRAGSNINSLQSRTFARIQLSKAREYFPGTQERALLVAGRLKQVIAALALILDKLQREGVAPLSSSRRPESSRSSVAGLGEEARLHACPGEGDEKEEEEEEVGSCGKEEPKDGESGGSQHPRDYAGDLARPLSESEGVLDSQAALPASSSFPPVSSSFPPASSSFPPASSSFPPASPSLSLPGSARLVLKLLVPQSLCGIIIGKSGATIRGYAAETGTSIRVVAGHATPLPLTHRVVTITGGERAVLKAVALLVLKQAEDQHYPFFGELPASFFGSGGALGIEAALAQQASAHAGLIPQAGPGGPQHLAAAYVAAGPGGLLPAGYASSAASPKAAAYAPSFAYPVLQPAAFAEPPPAWAGWAAPLPAPRVAASLALSEDQLARLQAHGAATLAHVQSAAGVSTRVEACPGPAGGGMEGGAEGADDRGAPASTSHRLVLAGAPEGVQLAQWMLGHVLGGEAAAQEALKEQGRPGDYAGDAYAGRGQMLGGCTYYGPPAYYAPLGPAYGALPIHAWTSPAHGRGRGWGPGRGGSQRPRVERP